MEGTEQEYPWFAVGSSSGVIKMQMQPASCL